MQNDRKIHVWVTEWIYIITDEISTCSLHLAQFWKGFKTVQLTISSVGPCPSHTPYICFSADAKMYFRYLCSTQWILFFCLLNLKSGFALFKYQQQTWVKTAILCSLFWFICFILPIKWMSFNFSLCSWQSWPLAWKKVRAHHTPPVVTVGLDALTWILSASAPGKSQIE